MRHLIPGILATLLVSSLAHAGPDAGAPKKVEGDSAEYPCNRFGLARSYTLKTEQVFADGEVSFARVTPARSEALARLQARSAQVSEVLVAGSRLLWSLPKSHPLGALKLVLVDEGPGRLVALDPARHRSYELPSWRLADLLEGGGRSSRSRHALEVTRVVESEDPAAQQRRLKMEGWLARAGLRRATGPGGTRRADLELSVKLWVEAGPSRLPHREALLALPLPLLIGQRGLPLLETISSQMGRPPLAWQVTVQARGRTATATVDRSSLIDRGWVRVPLCRLSTSRPAYAATAGEPGFNAPGKQLVPAADLAQLRPLIKGARGGPLTVDNRAPAAAMVTVDGVLVGWVAPHRKYSFKGLPPGFYRVRARSPLGSEAWGPYDMYLPGPLVLR